jgi:hypothetical protein
MNEEGPVLEALTHRLTECPADFLSEPRDKKSGSVHVDAVVYDLIRDLGGDPLTKDQLAAFEYKKGSKNRLQVVLIACWLLHDGWFRYRGRYAEQAYRLLATGLDELATLVQAQQFVTDPDRREELARVCLRALDLRPAGESVEQAQDRLTTLDSVERVRVIKEARAAEERARKIREEMARKAAEEAAAAYGRE